ncbi:protein kinase [Olsenella sp. DSM 107455]|uniref:non-specific serine/threonine protein kinase n=1 Tax=Thermophilibacter gallinarum TaxID=2779357 RepID=A0ABR9QR48_9ACTN|nr:protein kinase [Thermophilibacter gallinarum]MBE5023555.1 protein kinase [Thermophilibacter gallinarum]
MEDELSNYLSALDRDGCYRVDATLKDGRLETTQRVYFVGENGAELGPFVRKYLAPGLGGAYERIFAAQRDGVRLPHLPRIVECHRQDERLVVVMEHVAGETLADAAAAATDRLDLVRRVFPDLCDAVSELHELLDPPVIHRDLKPGNVMVSAAGVTLIDLGIARTWREGGEQDTTHFGTRAYAPPEQFGFGQTDVTSDVYALGMLLFFCLAGRDPAAADRERGFAADGVPEGLRDVIAHAAELDPARRLPSARAFKEALLAALGEKDREAEPPTFEASGTSPLAWLSRVPGWVGVAWNVLVAAACALLLIGCVGAMLYPNAELATWPTWYLLYAYLAFAMPVILVVSYLLLDRRPLRRRVPALARLTVRQEALRGLLVLLVVFAAWVVAAMAAGV